MDPMPNGAAPELTLTQDERAYHQHLMRQMTMAQGALESFGAYISQKYQLGPHHQLTPEGKIVMVTSEIPV